MILKIISLKIFPASLEVQFKKFHLSRFYRIHWSRLQWQWAKTRKKLQFQMCVWVVTRLPQRLKSTFFVFYSLRVPFGDPPLEKFSKNVDFTLWGKQCIFLPKGSFFCDLAHYDDSKSDVWNVPFWCLKNKLQPGGTTYNNELQKHCKRNSYLDEMTKFLYFYGIFEQLSYYCVTPLDLDNPHTLMSWPLPKATKETILLFSSR